MEKYLLLVSSAFLLVNGMDHVDDCSTPPDNPEGVKCCQFPKEHVWGNLKESMHECMRSLRNTTEDQPRVDGEDRHRHRRRYLFKHSPMDGCFMECVFQREGFLSNGRLDEAAMRKRVDSTLSADHEWYPIASAAVENCLSRDIVLKEGETCRSGSAEALHCIFRYMFTECPNWLQDDTYCGELREFYERCPNGPPPMHFRRRHHHRGNRDPDRALTPDDDQGDTSPQEASEGGDSSEEPQTDASDQAEAQDSSPQMAVPQSGGMRSSLVHGGLRNHVLIPSSLLHHILLQNKLQSQAFIQRDFENLNHPQNGLQYLIMLPGYVHGQNFAPGGVPSARNAPRMNSPDKTLPRSSVPEQALPRNGIPQQTTSQRNMQQEGLPQENMQQEGLPQESMQQQALPQENMQQEGSPRDYLPDEEVPQDTLSSQSDENLPEEYPTDQPVIQNRQRQPLAESNPLGQTLQVMNPPNPNLVN